MNQFVFVTIIAASLSVTFVLGGEPDAAGPVAVLYGMCLVGQGFKALFSYINDG